MQAYEMNLELLSSATVVERAVQNSELVIDDTAKSIENTG